MSACQNDEVDAKIKLDVIKLLIDDYKKRYGNLKDYIQTESKDEDEKWTALKLLGKSGKKNKAISSAIQFLNTNLQ